MALTRVFEVTGAAGTIDGVEPAFNDRVEALSKDPRVLSIKANVQTDGVSDTVLGPRVNIVGYIIDVEFADAA